MSAVRDKGYLDQLAQLWRWFVTQEASRYSPLYAALVSAAADDDALLALVASAPESSQYPLMTLAAVHDLVLAGELPDLAAAYRGDVPADRAPSLFRTAVLDRRDHVLEILHTRFIQTNECGRATPLALALAVAAEAVGQPVALIDAGASAGLNLLYDRYRLEAGDHGIWGDPASPVVCECEVSGAPPHAVEFVDVPVRVGLDRNPVDVSDPAAARWLLACTWPDTGRLERTRAAIEMAQASPPHVRQGDLVADIGALLGEIEAEGAVCVVTSWTLGYLDTYQRAEFVAALAQAALVRPIAWVSLELPDVVPGIDTKTPPLTTFSTAPSLVGLTICRRGRIESQRAVAHVHPHGEAFEWVGPSDSLKPDR